MTTHKEPAGDPQAATGAPPPAPFPRLTASRLELARACPGSFAISPHASSAPTEASERGTEIHAYLEALLDGASEPALPENPSARAACEGLDVGRLYALAGPEGADAAGEATHLTEQPLAWNPESFEAILVSAAPGEEFARRDYSSVPEGYIPGTADVVALYDDAVKVTDFKTGAGEVTHPSENPQLLLLALAAARVYARRRAVVQIVHVGEDGFLRPRRADLSGEDLARIERNLATLAERVEKSRTGTPELRPGRHCRFCPALNRCPAIAGEAQALLDDPLEELDPAAAAEAWRRLQAVEAAAKRVREALTLYVGGREAVELGDGRSLKLIEGRRQNLDPVVALEIVRGRHGLEAAYSAASVSPTSLKKALPSPDAVAEVLREVEETGGAKTSTYETLREVKGQPSSS